MIDKIDSSETKGRESEALIRLAFPEDTSRLDLGLILSADDDTVGSKFRLFELRGKSGRKTDAMFLYLAYKDGNRKGVFRFGFPDYPNYGKVYNMARTIRVQESEKDNSYYININNEDDALWTDLLRILRQGEEEQGILSRVYNCLSSSRTK